MPTKLITLISSHTWATVSATNSDLDWPRRLCQTFHL